MTKEDINEAAGCYSGSVLGFQDNPAVMAKHKAFVDGAEWRINKAWHNVTEEPTEQYTDDATVIIMENNVGDYKLTYYSKNRWKSTVLRYNIVRWAYMKDLTPDKEK